MLWRLGSGHCFSHFPTLLGCVPTSRPCHPRSTFHAHVLGLSSSVCVSSDALWFCFAPCWESLGNRLQRGLVNEEGTVVCEDGQRWALHSQSSRRPLPRDVRGDLPASPTPIPQMPSAQWHPLYYREGLEAPEVAQPLPAGAKGPNSSKAKEYSPLGLISPASHPGVHGRARV